jgi:hypothetical protein
LRGPASRRSGRTGDPWRERMYAGTAIVNGYGELIGIDQISE